MAADGSFRPQPPPPAPRQADPARESFSDLRRLADTFTSLASTASPVAPAAAVRVAGVPVTQSAIGRLARRLGATAVPLLARELAQGEPRRREVARDALAAIAATPARGRVIAALRDATLAAPSDDAKVCALGLLAELGERAEGRFADPPAIQRRSALALAEQLHTAADVANAVDLMVKQLAAEDIVQMIELIVESAPAVARRVAAELAARLDLDAAIRERIADVVLALAAGGMTAAAAPRRLPRPTQIALLVDDEGRSVVIASRKVSGERRWRRWAVLVGMHGRVDDCLYEVDATDASSLIASLCASGYHAAHVEDDEARAMVTAAVRASAATLDSSYYLGRDLLELAEAHLPRPHATAPQHALAAAIDRVLSLLHAGTPGDLERAGTILARIDSTTPCPDLDAARAACALAAHRPAAALEPLARAIAAEPGFPLHHWNLAAALHAVGDEPGSYYALRRFVATSAVTTPLDADPAQATRVAQAARTMIAIERAARLAGTPLATPRSSKTKQRT